MLRVASALIVIAVTGSPLARLACDVRCLSASPSTAEATAACHEATGDHGATIRATPESCAPVATIGPFMTETVYRPLVITTGAPLVTAFSLPSFGFTDADRAFLLRGGLGLPAPGAFMALRI
jgi:hypothetical protein